MNNATKGLLLCVLALAAAVSVTWAKAHGAEPEKTRERYETPYSNETQRRIREEREINRQIERDIRSNERREYEYQRRVRKSGNE